jgi:hypothetical protein
MLWCRGSNHPYSRSAAFKGEGLGTDLLDAWECLQEKLVTGRGCRMDWITRPQVVEYSLTLLSVYFHVIDEARGKMSTYIGRGCNVLERRAVTN